jgi:hypothetical protein
MLNHLKKMQRDEAFRGGYWLDDVRFVTGKRGTAQDIKELVRRSYVRAMHDMFSPVSIESVLETDSHSVTNLFYRADYRHWLLAQGKEAECA